jgi:hypothetical protein
VSPFVENVAIFAGMVVALLVFFEIGFRVGEHTKEDLTSAEGGQVGVIQAALLGLLGLLLAFSFAAAGARFLERQDLIVQEANAIGTSYLRADLLAEPHKTELRSALKRYVEHRIRATVGPLGTSDPAIAAEVEALHAKIWSAAIDGVRNNPELALSVLPPVNDVIDFHSTRVAAATKHIPGVVFGLLLVCSVLSVAVIGYGCGTAGRRRIPLTVSLTLIIAASLWITFDLDHPRRGLLQLNDAPLRALKFDVP